MELIETIYIFHDCFLVKTDKCAVIFDFWKNPDGTSDLPEPLALLPRDFPLFIFVSHGHKDHYNSAIFSWTQRFSNITFIVSEDVRRRLNHIINPSSIYKGPKINPEQLHVMRPGDFLDLGIIKIDAFDSTDIGNSYAVRSDLFSIFHAGDLNAWLWMEESTPEEIEESRTSYIRIIDKINEKFCRFDIVFFPVDSRIGKGFHIGAKIFLERFKVDCFYPMHFELWENETERRRRHLDASNFRLYATPNCRQYLQLSSGDCTALDLRPIGI